MHANFTVSVTEGKRESVWVGIMFVDSICPDVDPSVVLGVSERNNSVASQKKRWIVEATERHEVHLALEQHHLLANACRPFQKLACHEKGSI
jgi:hypothetical protein